MTYYQGAKMDVDKSNPEKVKFLNTVIKKIIVDNTRDTGDRFGYGKIK